MLKENAVVLSAWIPFVAGVRIRNLSFGPSTGSDACARLPRNACKVYRSVSQVERLVWSIDCCCKDGRLLTMLHWLLVFLVIALIAGVLGFGGIAGAAAGMAKILFLVFLVIWLVAFVAGRRTV
jgi:uncharacterized membrane protein YtjA (UPF0391 family)